MRNISTCKEHEQHEETWNMLSCQGALKLVKAKEKSELEKMVDQCL